MSCNDICTMDDYLGSVGEDGRLFLLNHRQKKQLRAYNSADSCSLTSSLFVKNDEVIKM